MLPTLGGYRDEVGSEARGGLWPAASLAGTRAGIRPLRDQHSPRTGQSPWFVVDVPLRRLRVWETFGLGSPVHPARWSGFRRDEMPYMGNWWQVIGDS